MRLAALILLPALATAQPYLNYRGARNAAGLLPPDHPAGAIAQGSTFILTGRNLGRVDGALDGSTVEISQGAVSTLATPIAASPTQVTAVMPADAPLGRVSARVTFNGRKSNAVLLQVVRSNVGLYAVNGLGFGPAAATNVGDDGGEAPNTAQSPAQPAGLVALKATGVGAQEDNVLEVFVGGVLAELVSSGERIVFRVPGPAPLGCYVPVQVRTNGAVVSNAVTISISASGLPCADAFNPASNAALAGGNIGLALPQRIVVSPGSITTDWVHGVLQRTSADGTFFNPALSLPPLGSCTVFATDQAWFDLFTPRSGGLDAGGAVTVTSAGSSVNLSAGSTFQGLLGKTPTLFYTGTAPFGVSLPGGADIGAVSGNFSMPPPLTWTNQDTIGAVNRSQPLGVSWTGADGDQNVVIILGRSRDEPHNVSGAFICAAAASDGAFTIPQYVLGSLPVSVPGAVSAPAAELALGVAAYPNPAPLSGTGLDAGFIIPSVFLLKTVVVR